MLDEVFVAGLRSQFMPFTAQFFGHDGLFRVLPILQLPAQDSQRLLLPSQLDTRRENFALTPKQGTRVQQLVKI